MAVDRQRKRRLEDNLYGSYYGHVSNRKPLRAKDIVKDGVDPSQEAMRQQERANHYTDVLNANADKPVTNWNKRTRMTKQRYATNARQISRDISSSGQTMDKRTRYRMQRYYNGLSVG